MLLSLLTNAIVACGFISSQSVFANGTDIIDEIGIEIPISCTMSGSGISTHNANIPNGTYQADIGSTTLHAFCNDNSGFAIYAAGYTGNEIGGTNSNKLVGASTSGNATIITGTATSAGNPDVSNWAMKLAIVQDSGDTTSTNAFTIDNSFNTYRTVPNEYTKVAHKTAGTDMTTSTGGVKLTTTYAAYISKTQPADTYSGQVIYALVHPSNETPVQSIPCNSGYICYHPNTAIYEGTMGDQTVSSSATSITLLASNYSKDGYGFAGWSNKYNYATNPNEEGIKFYGPQEDITFEAGQYDGESGTTNGLSLYAVWIKSQGDLQDHNKVSELCGVGTNALTPATFTKDENDESIWSITADLSSVSALTDTRDNQTYAVAKLTDGNCWMMENLRLDNTATLTITNTNNPLNDGTNVTLKHNYADTETYSTLSPSSNVAYDADTAPEGWCATDSEACLDQSRLRTNNTTNRATNPTTNDNAMYGYGNYYNWYSATAGRGTYSVFGNMNVEGDLCPAGWHLPIGTAYGEAGQLSNSLGGYKSNEGAARSMNSSTSPTASIMNQRFRHFPNNFLLSGQSDPTGIFDRGGLGAIWLATALNNNYTYNLFIYDQLVYPGTAGSHKYIGRTVRCIASSV